MTASRRFLAMLAVLAALECVASAQPAISAVLNAASYSAVVAPGCWVAVFGTNLATAPLRAQAVPLPVTLGGVSVTVAGRPAPLLYVSAGQINVLIPFEVEIPANTVVPLVVTSPAGSSSYNIRLTRNAPGIFTGDGPDTGRAFVFDLNFQAVGTIAAGDNVIFYATGTRAHGRFGPGNRQRRGLYRRAQSAGEFCRLGPRVSRHLPVECDSAGSGHRQVLSADGRLAKQHNRQWAFDVAPIPSMSRAASMGFILRTIRFSRFLSAPADEEFDVLDRASVFDHAARGQFQGEFRCGSFCEAL